MVVSIRKRLSPDFSLAADFETNAGAGCLGILGASGSGKSMTLKCIAGIETPDSGHIVLNGRTLFDSRRGINLRPQARRVGYLFQHYALFPTMTVLRNITAALKAPKPERRERGRRWIEAMGLSGLEDRYPSQLSGGQQQRTALARMLIQEPEAVLLDEPFSALDYAARERMQLKLLETLETFETFETFERAGARRDAILVTHSRDEAYMLCTDLVVMDKGRVEHTGSMEGLFQDPRTVKTALITGCKNISPARRTGADSVFALHWGLELRTARPVDADITHVGIRAHDITPAPANERSYNRVRPRPLRYSAEPFERTLLFTNADARTPEESGEIWWKYPKSLDTLPDSLFFPPESLLSLGPSPTVP